MKISAQLSSLRPFLLDKNFSGQERVEFVSDAIREISLWAERSKLEHEMPNDNGMDYNRGYVAAMNDVINILK